MRVAGELWDAARGATLHRRWSSVIAVILVPFVRTGGVQAFFTRTRRDRRFMAVP